MTLAVQLKRGRPSLCRPPSTQAPVPHQAEAHLRLHLARGCFNIRVLTPGSLPPRPSGSPPLESQCLQLSWPCPNIPIPWRTSSRFRPSRGASDWRRTAPGLPASTYPNPRAWSGTTANRGALTFIYCRLLLFYPPSTALRGPSRTAETYTLVTLLLFACLLAC